MSTSTAKKIMTEDTRFSIFLEVIGLLWELDGDRMKALAEEAGIHYVTLYNWRTGVVGAPNLRTFLPVCQALGYEVRLVRAKRPRLYAVK